MKKKKGGGRHALLYPSLLSLVHNELLEFLLVAVAELGEIDIREAAAEGVHCC